MEGSALPQIYDWQEKVDPWVMAEVVQGEVEFLVLLTAQADLSGASLLSDKQAKGVFVYQQLTKTAARAQKPLLVYLESMGVAHRPFWIANMVWVRAGQDVVQQLARRQDVSRIAANPAVRQEFIPTNPDPSSAAAAGSCHRMEPLEGACARSLERWFQRAKCSHRRSRIPATSGITLP